MSASNLPEEKKKLLRFVLSATGFIFAALGVASIIFPSAIGDMIFGGDSEMGKIFGAALLLVGITDIAIANTLFKEKR